jgi:adenylylsulfate kinase-like enzyme
MCRNFVEVYVSTPLEACERRDPKGLYAKARRGEIANFTGISDAYEPPTQADLIIDTTQVPSNAAVTQVLAEVHRRMRVARL